MEVFVFNLTRRERLLLASILLLFLVGWSYQTWRGHEFNRRGEEALSRQAEPVEGEPR